MTKRIIETEAVTHRTKNALDLAARQEGVPVEQLLGHVAPKAPVRGWGSVLTIIICMTISFSAAWFFQADRLDGGNTVLAESKQPASLSTAEIVNNILKATGDDINRSLGKSGGNVIHRVMRPKTPTEVIDSLATTGADFNFRRVKDGRTPLAVALHRGAYVQIIHILTHYRDKVDLTIENNNGRCFNEILMFKLTNPTQQDPRLVAIKKLVEEA